MKTRGLWVRDCSLIHSFNSSFTRLTTHSRIHASIRSFIHPFISSFLFIFPFIFMHSFIDSFIFTSFSLIHLFVGGYGVPVSLEKSLKMFLKIYSENQHFIKSCTAVYEKRLYAISYTNSFFFFVPIYNLLKYSIYQM